MFEIKNLSLTLGEKLILKNINLKLTDKKIGIIGHNGSGKSSFLKCLNGLNQNIKGKIEFKNLEIYKNLEKIRTKIGFIFQNPEHQIIFPSVREELEFGLKNLLNYSIKQRNEKVDMILEKFHFFHKKEYSVYELSGGEKRVLSLLSVLVLEPETILFDEPTTYLDLAYKLTFLKLIENLNQQMIIATHDLELLENFDRVLVFSDGQVIYDNTAKNSILYYKKMTKSYL